MAHFYIIILNQRFLKSLDNSSSNKGSSKPTFDSRILYNTTYSSSGHPLSQTVTTHISRATEPILMIIFANRNSGQSSGTFYFGNSKFDLLSNEMLKQNFKTLLRHKDDKHDAPSAVNVRLNMSKIYLQKTN
jgi:hypothetical protein